MIKHHQGKILRVVALAGVLACFMFFSACAAYSEFMGGSPPAEYSPAASGAGQHWDKAMQYRSQGQLEQAAKELEQAIKADPNMYHAYYQLGITYTMLGQKDKAREIWEKGISQARKGPEREDYSKEKAIGQMQAALAGMESKAMPPRASQPTFTSRPARDAAPAKVKPGALSGPYAVLFSSNLNPKYAKADQARLAKLGYPAQVKVHHLRGKTWHRVWVGCCSGYERAKQLAAAMRNKGLKSQLTVMRVGN